MKTCIITNDQFSWVLNVDGKIIPFQGSENANYFLSHYVHLGYEVNFCGVEYINAENFIEEMKGI